MSTITLNDLKGGDKVVIWKGKSPDLSTVSRVTNTFVILEFKNYVNKSYEKKYYKKDGWEVGAWDRYEKTRIEVCTSEKEASVLQYKRFQEVISIFPAIPQTDVERINRIHQFLKSENLLH